MDQACSNHIEIHDDELFRILIEHLDDRQISALLSAVETEDEFYDVLRDRIAHLRRHATHTFSNEVTHFYAGLQRLMHRVNLRDSQVYNAAGISRTLWYHIKRNPNAQTDKRNVLKIGIVLRLNYWELYYLVNLAGYPFLPGGDPTDGIVADCILSNLYDPDGIDEKLYNRGLDTLFSIA